MSSTSSSWRRTTLCRRPAFAPLPASFSATKTLPSASYHAGMRWPHHSWRETHQGWIFSSQLNQVFFQVSGTIADLARAHRLDRRLRPASPHRHTIGRSATARSPRPSGRRRASGSCGPRPCPARPRASSSSTTRLRASNRSRPSSSAGIRPSAVWTTRASASSMLSISAGLEPGALADLEIVEVVPRRDLDRARAKLRIGMFVGDDRDQPAGDRHA